MSVALVAIKARGNMWTTSSPYGCGHDVSVFRVVSCRPICDRGVVYLRQSWKSISANTINCVGSPLPVPCFKNPPVFYRFL